MNRLDKKKILITQSQDYMAPAITELFQTEGAQLICKPEPVPDHGSLEDYATDCHDIDILIANLAHDPCNSPVGNILDTDWQALFSSMVHPLMVLIRHFAPMMAARRLVVLRDVHEAAVDQLQSLQGYCEEPSPSTVLVLLGRKWPGCSR